MKCFCSFFFVLFYEIRIDGFLYTYIHIGDQKKYQITKIRVVCGDINIFNILSLLLWLICNHLLLRYFNFFLFLSCCVFATIINVVRHKWELNWNEMKERACWCWWQFTFIIVFNRYTCNFLFHYSFLHVSEYDWYLCDLMVWDQECCWVWGDND
jgi:hypothetical protein